MNQNIISVTARPILKENTEIPNEKEKCDTIFNLQRIRLVTRLKILISYQIKETVRTFQCEVLDLLSCNPDILPNVCDLLIV
jgi:hypothetical protein